MTTEHHGPLAGVRVMDMTTAWAGPFGGRVLAFLGAEVIHIESATRLDLWRGGGHGLDPVRYPDLDPGARPYNRTVLFNSQNLNKLSLTVDVKKPGGREVLLKLAAVSDVVLSNFTPGTLERMGLGYEALKEARPDIIVLEMPAFGNTGPMAHHGALGPGMEFSSGMSAFVGYESEGPMPTGPAYLDPIGGYNAAAAILTALVCRQATGQGQYIEMSQVEAAMPFIGELILDSLEAGTSPHAHGNRVAEAAPHDAYPALGVDAWIAIGVTSDAEWRALAEIIGAPQLGVDVRYATADARWKNQDELREPISNWTRHITKHDAAARLQAAGIAAAPVQDGKDIVEDPYLSARGFFTALDHPEAGRRTYQGLPFKLSRTPGGQHRAAPCLGEHTVTILRDILRLSEADIAALEQSGTISNVPPEPPRSTKIEQAKTPGGARA
jgi:crotonobetainyl-CoA:carnitine CoA-transferase CaiB-like acyl-CoA transferase